MKKIVLIFFGLLLLFACNNNEKRNDNNKEQEYKIGVILPLTGDAAIYGQSMKNGILMAYDSCSNKKNIKLLFQDDKGESKTSVSALNNLLTENVIAIIGGAQSKTAAPLIPVIKKNKIPLISPAASSIDFDRSTNYFLRLWPSDSYDGQILAEYIKKTYPKGTKIAVFYTGSAYGEGIKNVFISQIKDSGLKLAFLEQFDEKATDYKTQIQKIKESKASVLFLPGYYANIRTILKQIEELNLKINIIGTTSFYDDKLLNDKTLTNVLEGVVFSYPAFNKDDKYGKTKRFLTEYKNKYKIDADVFSANAYDCLYVIDSALTIGINNAVDLKNNIYKIKNYKGVSGIFSFDQYGNVRKQFLLYKIHKQKPLIIE